MTRPNVTLLVAQARRDLDAIEASWARGVAAARLEDDSPGLAATAYDTGPAGSGPVSRPTEVAALRGTRDRRAELERLLVDATGGLHRLAHLLAAHAPVRARIEGDRVRIDCANPYGCPEAKPARRQGLCPACWDFHDRNERHRVAQDVAEQIARTRAGAAERKRRQREGG